MVTYQFPDGSGREATFMVNANDQLIPAYGKGCDAESWREAARQIVQRNGYKPPSRFYAAQGSDGKMIFPWGS